MKKKTVEPQQYDFLVNNLKAFQDVFSKCYNPLERMMATHLLTLNLPFVYQKRIDIDGIANGRKFFIVDFYVEDVDLIIETDGQGHYEKEQHERDRIKDMFLTSMGYHIFRFDWNDVMRGKEDWDILTFIKDYMSSHGYFAHNINWLIPALPRGEK